jgi:hypothetical protein
MQVIQQWLPFKWCLYNGHHHGFNALVSSEDGHFVLAERAIPVLDLPWVMA